MKRQSFILLCAALFFLGTASALAQTEVHEKLLPFKDLCGRNFKGKISKPDAEREQWNVMRFERALNGNAVRILHSVNDGEYGGETILFWDEGKQSLAYYYFTTAGFYTQGTMKMVTDSKWTTQEKLVGTADGVTEVRSTGEILRDGTLKMSSEYLKKGKWVPGHGATYEPAGYIDPKFR
jgi:hypothetical protein